MSKEEKNYQFELVLANGKHGKFERADQLSDWYQRMRPVRKRPKKVEKETDVAITSENTKVTDAGFSFTDDKELVEETNDPQS